MSIKRVITNVIKLLHPNTLISKILKVDFGWATLIISHAKIYTWYDEYGIWHQMCNEAKTYSYEVSLLTYHGFDHSIILNSTETDYISADDCINQHYLSYDVLSHHMTKLCHTKFNKLFYKTF